MNNLDIYLLIPLTEIKLAKAYQAIAEMRADLEYYAKKPDAKDSYIEKINDRIDKLLDVLESYKTLTEILLEQNKLANDEGYRRGFKIGYDEAKGIDTNKLDKERTRFDNKEKLMKDMPHLF